MRSKVTGQKLAKRLPTDKDGNFLETFIANKRFYTIRTPNEILTGKRWLAYLKLKPMLAYNCIDLRTFHNKLDEIETNLGKMAFEGPKLYTTVVAQVKALKDEAFRMTKQKNDLAMMLCTLFVLSDNEDTTVFSEKLANEKIKDWEEEGYLATDFLSLVARFSPDVNALLARSYKSGKNE